MLTPSTTSDGDAAVQGSRAMTHDQASLLNRLTGLAKGWLRFEAWPQSLALLAARLYLFEVFFQSGLTKVKDWDATLFLFNEEYHVPILPPELAAWMGTGGELVFSSLLAMGLLTRPAALGLFVVNLMAAISYPDLAPAALKDHYLWGVLALGLALFGAGKLSVDGVVWRRWLMPSRT
jgi:putative oxidoreductase